MIRSSFLNAWVFALAFAARYDDALEASDEQIAEAKRFRLSFALSQAYLTRATVCRGVRAFSEAGSWLEKAERAAISIRADKFEAQSTMLGPCLSLPRDVSMMLYKCSQARRENSRPKRFEASTQPAAPWHSPRQATLRPPRTS